MNVDQMRQEILKVYKGASAWQKKLRQMPDNQVIAFYRRLQREG